MHRLKHILLLLAIALPVMAADPFIVVIDPGHGGSDPGTCGKNGQEKTINLNVALKLGTYIKTNHDDVKVVYTRTTDKRVALKDRPDIANKADGDLFISIHTNGVESSQPYGAETYTIGLAKTNQNFEVAKRENSVLLLEEGNKETYQDFDPTSPDSYIMFEFMQSKYIDQSVEIAYYIQQQFSSIKRLDRGVRQAPFWVLHQVKMPSILVELGFISNPTEEKFLLSSDGQTKLAKCIYDAFAKYKHEYDKRTITQLVDDTPATTTPKTETKQDVKPETKTAPKPRKQDKTPAEPVKPAPADQITFRIQTFSTRDLLPENHDELRRIRHLKPIHHIHENGWYKYYCTETTSWTKAQENLKQVRTIHSDAFIVPFRNGKKVPLTDRMKTQK